MNGKQALSPICKEGKMPAKPTTRTAMMMGVIVALGTLSAYAQDSHTKAQIIERCRASMGEYGTSMVKFCVDQDIAAYNALAGYPAEARAIIESCTTRMLEYGWNMVKFCADQDIAAEEALSKY
jgi:hypothetical protein